MSSEGAHKKKTKIKDTCFPKCRCIPYPQNQGILQWNRPICVLGCKQHCRTETELPWIIQSTRSSSCYLYLSLISKGGELEVFIDNRGEEEGTVGMNCCPTPQMFQHLQGCV